MVRAWIGCLAAWCLFSVGSVAPAAAAQPGAFPVYNIRDYGAVGDGVRLDTGALQAAIDAATAAGGGRVYAPPGTYLTGTIQLRDNVTLYLEAGAVVLGSPRREDYRGEFVAKIGAFIEHPSLIHADPPFPPPAGTGFRIMNYDMYFRNVAGLQLRNMEFTWNSPEKAEWGSALRLRNVRDLEVDGFRGRQSLNSGAPAIRLRDVERAVIRDSTAPPRTGTFLQVEGETRIVSLLNNDFSQAEQVVQYEGSGPPEAAVFQSGNRPPSR